MSQQNSSRWYRVIPLIGVFFLVQPCKALPQEEDIAEGMVEVIAEGVEETTFDVVINPVNLFVGAVNADLYYGIYSSIAIGLSVSYYEYSLSSTSMSGLGFGAKMLYYLTGHRFQNGWFLSPSVDAIPFEYRNASGSQALTSFALGATAGYHWVWDNGFNMMAGLGAKYYTTASAIQLNGTRISTPAFSGLLPDFTLSLGYVW